MLEAKLDDVTDQLDKCTKIIDSLKGTDKKKFYRSDGKLVREMARTDLKGDLDIEEDALMKVQEVSQTNKK